MLFLDGDSVDVWSSFGRSLTPSGTNVTLKSVAHESKALYV